MKRIAILASGSGSNAKAICRYFEHHAHVEVALIVSNRKNAGVFQIAESFNVPTVYVPKSEWEEKEQILKIFNTYHINFVVLAGFLLLIPSYLTTYFKGSMVNIHPALLPAHGGHGMYGMHVHQAVKAAGDKISGPTIHWVSPAYDEGATIFQATCNIEAEDTVEDIARKVLQLEHLHYPRVIESILLNLEKGSIE